MLPVVAAGFNVIDLSFQTDRAPLTRLGRTFIRGADLFREHQPSVVFGKRYDFIPRGAWLCQLLPPDAGLVLSSQRLPSVVCITVPLVNGVLTFPARQRRPV